MYEYLLAAFLRPIPLFSFIKSVLIVSWLINIRCSYYLFLFFSFSFLLLFSDLLSSVFIPDFDFSCVVLLSPYYHHTGSSYANQTFPPSFSFLSFLPVPRTRLSNCLDHYINYLSASLDLISISALSFSLQLSSFPP